VTPNRYEPFIPVMLDWIERTLESHAASFGTVASFGFRRLPLYFSEAFLDTARVVITNPVPVPPLSKWGLAEFAGFEAQENSGITYRNTYFVHPSAAESVHFHELVHVIQWQILGPKEFLLMYAAGLAEHGYLDCPLEAMAYNHQARFCTGQVPYSVEVEVGEVVLALAKG